MYKKAMVSTVTIQQPSTIRPLPSAGVCQTDFCLTSTIRPKATTAI